MFLFVVSHWKAVPRKANKRGLPGSGPHLAGLRRHRSDRHQHPPLAKSNCGRKRRHDHLPLSQESNLRNQPATLDEPGSSKVRQVGRRPRIRTVEPHHRPGTAGESAPENAIRPIWPFLCSSPCAGLPLALALMDAGKVVFLANLTITYLGGATAEWLAPHLAAVTPETREEERYFPEHTRW